EGPWSYDTKGNPISTVRTAAGNALIDSLVYHYSASSDQLDHVSDAIAVSHVSGDLTNQGSGNYAYDACGRRATDLAGGIGLVVYDPFGRPADVYRTAGGGKAACAYSPEGSRLLVRDSTGTSYFVGADDRSWFARCDSATARGVWTITGI